MAGGLWYNVNYTYAKGLTDVDLRSYTAGIQQNQYARFLERADDGNLRRHQLRVSHLYDLPFGRGHHLLGGISRPADFVLGGWQLAGIVTLVTGQRLSPAYSNADPANTNQVAGRPDRTGDGNFDASRMRDTIRSRASIFDRSAFLLPASGRGFYGNSARYILTGPGQLIWNAGVHRNWKLAEGRAVLQFRWEGFNASNRANFNNPATNIQSGAFGLVTTAGSGRSMLFGLRLDY